MKKLFSLLAVAAMAFTACQNDEGVKNPTLADEGIVNLNVGVPELATRALDGDGQFGADSAYGAIDYANYTSFLETEYDVRFQLAVYEAGAAEDAEPIYTDVKYVDFASTTNFNDLRFVPGREYQFVIFADFVKQGTEVDFRYNTADLRNITAFEALNAMDETYDAYFFNQTLKVEAGKVNELEAVLKRPFGKVRVLTTDLAWVEKYAVPAEADVTFYNHAIYKSFNAVTGEVATEATNAEETISYEINHDYYAATMYEGKEACTLFATYVLATDAQEALNFRLDTKEIDGSLIKSLDFNTEIPYQRNHLTTLVGNLLTNEADVFVRIDDNFDAEEFVKGDFENLETGLGYVREGVQVAGQVYEYETNLFTFWLLSETDGTALRAGRYEYTEEVAYLQNATGFRINGIDVEKGTLTVTDRGTRAGNFYDVVFDIYATINGKTENYILTWNGELKAARTQLAEPVVTYEVDEVDYLYITFSWDAVEGAKNYTVEWNGEKQTVEGTSATFDFSGEDTYATAYVTANPEFTWSYTASTGSVTVDWKKPIVYTEVEVFLQMIKGDEIAFYNDNYTVYFENYPSLEGAWYQVKGQIPTPFSPEAEVVEAVGSAAQVAIFEPTTATCFLYKGALDTPYVLTEAQVNWTDGANTVAVAFSNEAGDAITIHTAVPLTEGRFDIDPSYVAIGGEQAPEIQNTEMNVLLDKGVYTVFFNVHSAINTILMVYTGAIDFEKPYAPQYVLESYTAGAETIYFESENAKFEIEATSLESGDVAVKMLILDGSDDYAAANQVTAATAVVKEENGVYDARYTVTVNLPIVGAKTFDLQYVGTFVPYSAPVEPEKPIEFEATYEVKAGAYFFTGVNYNFSIIVNNLATTEYISGETEDAWAYDWTLGQPMNNFRTGDFLTVENNVVTLEFTAAPFGQELRYKMTCDMNPAVQEPEDITVELALENGLYVGGNYQIDYYQGVAVVYVQNVAAPNNMIDQVTVYDDADELVFEFVDTYNNANVTAIYTKNVVAPATDVEVYLTLENGIYYGLYETTTYAISVDDGIAQAQFADGTKANFIYEMSENTTFVVFTFADTVNNVNVTALYQKTNAPAEPVYDNLTTLNNNESYSSNKYGYQWHFVSEAGFYGDFYVANGKNTSELVEGEYTWHAMYADGAGTPGFTVSMRDANRAMVTVTSASLKVEGKVVYLTVNENYFKGEIATVEPGQPGTDEPVDEWTNLTEVAQKTTVYGREAYATDNYTLAGGYWYFAGGFVEGGQYTTETTATGFIFTFDDETNKRHVTITYSSVVDLLDWAFSAALNGDILTLTGEDGTVVTAKLQGQYGLGAGTYYFNNPGIYNASDATLNGEAAEADGTITMNANTYTITLNMTINGAKITGTSKNALF
uniref:DUF6562 domain-containing protein n=1 Tax=Alistipes sp. TaxID=1872444 RepID=UPI0040568E63